MPRTTEAVGRADCTRAFRPRGEGLSAELAGVFCWRIRKNRFRREMGNGRLYEPTGMRYATRIVGVCCFQITVGRRWTTPRSRATGGNGKGHSNTKTVASRSARTRQVWVGLDTDLNSAHREQLIDRSNDLVRASLHVGCLSAVCFGGGSSDLAGRSATATSARATGRRRPVLREPRTREPFSPYPTA